MDFIIFCNKKRLDLMSRRFYVDILHTQFYFATILTILPGT